MNATDEHYLIPSDIEVSLTHLLQPLITKLTDLEVQVTTLSTQQAELLAEVARLKSGKVAKFLGVA